MVQKEGFSTGGKSVLVSQKWYWILTLNFHQVLKKWISSQECLDVEMDIADLFFEVHPSNLSRINFNCSCKNAEILVMVSQMVSDLAKISIQSSSFKMFSTSFERSITYRIDLNATPGFYFMLQIFDPILPYKKRIINCI